MRGAALAAVLLLQTMTGSLPVAVAAEPAAIVAAFNDAPPMAFTNSRGAVDGALIRVAERLFAAAGLPWSGAAYPAPRLVKGLQDGSFNFSMLVRMPALDACCLFSTVPVIVQEPRVYFLAGTPPVSSKEGLAGHSLIVVNGFTYAGLIQYVKDPANAIIVEVAETLNAAFRMLAAGRADYLLSYEANARSVLAVQAIPDIQSRVVGRVPVYLVLSKTYPDAAATLGRLERLTRGLDIPAIMAED